jgi:hypothetical protein
MVNTKERPGIFERHLHIARHRGGSQSELSIGKFETAAWARKRDVEGFAGELVDLGTRLALQDPWYLNPCRPTFQVASISIGRNKVSQNSEQVDAKTEKALLKGLQASPEIIVFSAMR